MRYTRKQSLRTIIFGVPLLIYPHKRMPRRTTYYCNASQPINRCVDQLLWTFDKKRRPRDPRNGFALMYNFIDYCDSESF